MENDIEKAPSSNQEHEEKIIDGVKYRRINTGYTLRQYYSHSTPEKGPGPGWDFRWGILEKYNIDEPSELPDEPYYVWEEIVDEK